MKQMKGEKRKMTRTSRRNYDDLKGLALTGAILMSIPNVVTKTGHPSADYGGHAAYNVEPGFLERQLLDFLGVMDSSGPWYKEDQRVLE